MDDPDTTRKITNHHALLTPEEQVMSDGLEAFANECFGCADDKGWHEDQALGEEVADTLQRIEHAKADGLLEGPYAQLIQRLAQRFMRHGGVQVMEKLMLMVSEIAEAAEDYRRNDIPLTLLYGEVNGARVPMTLAMARDGVKPCGFPSELADVIIRSLDHALELKIPIVHALLCKSAFNRTRSHRHGGKLA